MPVFEYIPPAKKIIDHSSTNGDYYKAQCDVCGTEFYPKRRTAKYCNPNCKLIQHRIECANGKIVKEIIKSPKTSQSKRFRGAKNVYLFLKDKYDTWGDRNLILDELTYLEIGESWEYGKSNFEKISVGIFELK